MRDLGRIRRHLDLDSAKLRATALVSVVGCQEAMLDSVEVLYCT